MKATSHYSADFFKGPESVKSTRPASNNGRNSLLSKIQSFLISDTTEPRIQQKRDRFGHIYWHTYDPMTSQTRYFESEYEVCQWLEKRYYQ
jgi:hypothetical protein